MGRAPPHCSSSDQNGLKKGPWTPEEDQKLIDYIQKHGYGNWRSLPKNAGLERCGKSCRLRWTNYLRPDIKRGRFSFEEEESIIQLHSILGNKWSTIAASLPGRTDNEIKNYWNTRIRKRLLKMGIDPVTHRPRLNLVHDHLSSIVHSYLYNNQSSSSPPPLADQIVMNYNMSRFLGLQNNSHQPCDTLLKPATSVPLSSSHHHQQNSPSNFHMPQHNEEIHPHHAQLINDNNHHAPVQTQPQFGTLPPLILTSSPKFEAEPPFPTSTQSPCFPYPSSDQPQPIHHSSLPTYPLMNISVDFDAQFLCDLVPNCTTTEGSEDGRNWQRHETALPSHEFQTHIPARYDQRDPTNILDIWSHNDATLDQSSGRGFFTLPPPTVFSTPSSSPTPLNSTTTTNTTTDDERESYCSSIFRFDIPHIFEDFII